MKLNLKDNFKSNQAIYYVLIIGLIIRCLYLYFYSNLPDWELLTVDNNYHHNWALSILSGNVSGDTTYFRAPFYIYYLSALYKIFGVSLWAVRIGGIVIGLLSIFLTYKIASRIFNKSVGVIASFIHAVYPVMFYFESELLLDSLFTLMLQAAVYYFIRWWDNQTNLTLFTSGLLFSLTVITRPTPLVLLPLFIIAIFMITQPMKLKFIRTFIFVLGAAVFIIPIFARNIIVADDPVLIASSGGINFYIGNNETADGISAIMPEPLGFNWRIQDITFIAQNELKQTGLKPGEVSSFWFSKGIDWIKNNPGDFSKLYLKKLYYNFTDQEVSNNRQLFPFFDKIPLLKYSPFSFGSIFALSLVGLFLAGFKNRKLLFIAGLVLTYILVSSLFFFNSRFRLPLLPFYFVSAGFCLYYIVNQLKSNTKGALLNLSLVIFCGLFSFYPVIALPPGSPSQTATSRGLFYISSNNYPEALNYFKKAYQIDPQFPETNLNLGVAFLRLGIEDSALYYFNREIKLFPKRSKAYTNLASVSLLNNKIEQADNYINLALELKPYNITANMVQQRLAFKQSSDSLAIVEDLSQSFSYASNNIYYLYDGSLLYSNQSNTAQAKRMLTSAVESSPPPIETDDEAFQLNSANTPLNWLREKSKCYNQLSYLFAMENDLEMAVAYAEQAIATDSNNVDAYSNLISGYLSQGANDTAIQYLNLALNKFPTNQNLLRIKKFLQ